MFSLLSLAFANRSKKLYTRTGPSPVIRELTRTATQTSTLLTAKNAVIQFANVYEYKDGRGNKLYTWTDP